MRNIAIALVVLALLVLSPPLGLLALVVVLARRFLMLYARLWLRLARCELLTPAIAAAGVSATAASPYVGAAKLVLLVLGLSALYLAPIAPRASRLVATLAAGLAVEAPFKPAVVLAALFLGYYLYKYEACGYICVKAPTMPQGDLAFSPKLGVVCAFEKGGVDMAQLWLRLGDSYAICSYAACLPVSEETFKRGVSTVENYVPEPEPPVFKGVINVVATPDTALRLLSRHFPVLVVIAEGVEARSARLVSASKIEPVALAEIYGAVYGLSPEQKIQLRDLLEKGEAMRWSTRHAWLRPLVEVWEGGEEPTGAVKSRAAGKAGVLDSLLYAYLAKAPVLTDRKDVAKLAGEKGFTVFLLSGEATGNFLITGPAVVKLPEGSLEVGPGGYLLHVGGLIYGGLI